MNENSAKKQKSAEFVCIACPLGCRLKVSQTEEGLLVEGNRCKRGESYGRQEFSAPQRVVTSTVRVDGRGCVVCPVKTASPVPKAKVPEVLAAIYGISASVPLKIGQVLAEDIAGTGVKLIVTANMG
ncbi:MAG: DUF1667 domain-containing protein [Christensenellaceae bacterium]|jgi:CxxC motif-containing protein|nr:DUF1667 domain-containing protein [Christensenellaceae bacterium]